MRRSAMMGTKRPEGRGGEWLRLGVFQPEEFGVLLCPQ